MKPTRQARSHGCTRAGSKGRLYQGLPAGWADASSAGPHNPIAMTAAAAKDASFMASFPPSPDGRLAAGL